MKYRVTIDGREREVDVQIAPSGAVSVTLDGSPVEADAVPIPGGVSLRIGSRVYDVVVGGKPEAMTVAAGPHRIQASVESERARTRRRREGVLGDAAKEIRSPMPGRIVKVLVKAGDEVAAGQPVVVMEAMKMENELRAVAPAKVASVEVQPGQPVEANVLLVRFE